MSVLPVAVKDPDEGHGAVAQDAEVVLVRRLLKSLLARVSDPVGPQQLGDVFSSVRGRGHPLVLRKETRPYAKGSDDFFAVDLAAAIHPIGGVLQIGSDRGLQVRGQFGQALGSWVGMLQDLYATLYQSFRRQVQLRR